LLHAVFFLAVGLLKPPGMHAQGEKMPWVVIGTGGVIGATDGNVVFSATLGQPIIGPGTDGTLQIQQGFWLPLSTAASVDQIADGEAGTGAFNLGNYPNPFSTTTTISYRLDERSRVKLDIVDLLGKKVITLVDQVQDGGEQRREWNGMTEAGGPASGGIYLYILSVEPIAGMRETGGVIRSERRKLLLVR
jgi:hypothetical protein